MHRPRDTGDFFAHRFRLIAHRGRTGDCLENTTLGFVRTAAEGFDFELDARPCADGELVVHHDDLLERTTSGRGRVDAATVAELGRVDAGDGHGVPVLADVLRDHARTVRITVEVKTEATESAALVALSRTVVETVDRVGVAGEVVVGSFNTPFLAELRRLAPAILRAQIFDRIGADDLDGPAAPDLLMPHRRLATADYLAAVHARGFRVHVWTVNEPDEMRRLHRLRVGGIITDRPLVLRATLA